MLEIVGKTAQRDDYWNVRSIGSDCSGHALQDSRFVFWLAVRQRRALVKAGVATFLRRGSTVQNHTIRRISRTASRSVVSEEASTKARAEVLTASRHAASLEHSPYNIHPTMNPLQYSYLTCYFMEAFCNKEKTYFSNCSFRLMFRKIIFRCLVRLLLV